MDLSKLPKMSQTPPAPPPEPPAAPEPGRVPVGYPGAPAGGPMDTVVGAEVWLSGIIGLVLMMMGRNFPSWLLAAMTGQTFHTGVNWQAGDLAGQEVAYWQLQGFTALSDMSIFLFGLAMIMEAVALLAVAKQERPGVGLVAVALGLSVLVTVLNLATVVVIMGAGYGLPIMSMLAVAFGGYMAFHELRLLKIVSAMRAAR